MSRNIEILGIPFTTLREGEVINLIKTELSKPESAPLFIATPNPEMLLECSKNRLFKKVIQNTGLNLPDGNGLIWARKFLSKNSGQKNRFLVALRGAISLPAFLLHRKNDQKRFQKAIHGSDLTMKICLDPEISRQGVFLLGNKLGLKANTAQLAAEKLQNLSKSIKISGYLDTTPDDMKIAQKILKSDARILLVAFGAPTQELWIAQHLSSMPNIKLAMGIGGTFDFIAGIVPRAPAIMRKTGLEWLYRLFKQPKRLGRIINATLVFPYTVIRSRLTDPEPANPDKYNISDT